MKIEITYKDDINISSYNEQVYINEINVGYIERGVNHGFWFRNKLGVCEDMLTLELSELKKRISNHFNNYNKFFEKLWKKQ